MKTIKTRTLSLSCITAALALASLAGCTKYYKVTDPASGKVFYTTSVDQSKKAGYIEFTDAATQSNITLQSSEVKKISKEQYQAATGGK